MKKLLIISSEYPFGLKEQFLNNEVNMLKTEFAITLIPTEFNKNSVIRSNYTGFNVLDIRKTSTLKKIAAIVKTLSFFCSKVFWSEFKFMLKKGFSVRNLGHLIMFTIKGEYKYRLIRSSFSGYGCTDTVIYSYWFYYQSFISSRLKSKFNNKTISRAHGFDLYEYRNKGDYIAYRNYILDTVDKLYLISNNGYQYLESKYKKYAEKFVVNKLGTTDFGLADCNATQIVKIVSCSWMVPIKRINLVVETLSLITEFRIEWTHFGSGPLFGLIKERCSKLPKNISFHLKGQTENKDIIDFYKDNHVDWFINVSESEGIPVSIMEAISFGIPIIATNVGGNSEIVIDGKNGYLLDKNFDLEDLKLLIEMSVNMTFNERQKLRKNSRTIWQESYNILENIKGFEDEIKELYKH